MSPQSRLLNRGWQREVCGLPRVPDLTRALFSCTRSESLRTLADIQISSKVSHMCSLIIFTTHGTLDSFGFVPVRRSTFLHRHWKVSALAHPAYNTASFFLLPISVTADIRITFFYAFMSSNFYMALLRGLPLCWLYEGEFNITV